MVGSWRHTQEEEQIIQTVREIFNKAATEDELIREFLGLQVFRCKTYAIQDVTSILYEIAVNDPEYSEFYARLCFQQVANEIEQSKKCYSTFCDVLLKNVKFKLFFNNSPRVQAFLEKIRKFEKFNAKKETEKLFDLTEEHSQFRNELFGGSIFAGNLYLQNVCSREYIAQHLDDLLNVLIFGSKTNSSDLQEDFVEWVAHLLNLIGKRLYDTSEAKMGNSLLNSAIKCLQKMIHIVRDKRIRFMITDLADRHENEWKNVDDFPGGIEEPLIELETNALRDQGDVFVNGEEYWKGMYEEATRDAEELHAKNEESKQKCSELTAKCEDIERKYRKLLMIVGRANTDE